MAKKDGNQQSKKPDITVVKQSKAADSLSRLP